MTDTGLQRPRTVYEALGFARALRQQGDLSAAASILDAALSQATLQVPPTAELSAHVGWLHLERATICEARGEMPAADEHGLRGLNCFERAGDRGGQAVASLALGDLSAQTGAPGSAARWWERAASLADNVGNTALAARALAALALQELAAGGTARAQALLDAGEERVVAGVDGLVAHGAEALRSAAEEQGQAARAALTVVRCREAIRAGHWSEARLLLAVVAQAARDLQSTDLYVAAMRLDADVARRGGDPRSAVEALVMARDAAAEAGLQRQAALLDCELVLAHANNESWSEAFEVQGNEPGAAIAAQPAIHAARLEGFAVLSRQGGNPVAAERALREALEVRQNTGDRVAAGRCQALLADVLRAGGQHEQAWAEAESAGEIGRDCGLLAVTADAALVQLQIALMRQDRRVTELAQRASALMGPGVSVARRIVVLDAVIAAHLQRGDIEQARAILDQIVELADGQPLVRLQARVRCRKAQLALRAGELVHALHLAQEAAELAGRAADGDSRCRALLVAGLAMLGTGRHDEALLALGYAMNEAMASGRTDLAAEAAFELGNGQLRIGRLREARHAFAQAAEQADRVGAVAVQASALRGQASCLAGEGDVEGAVRILAQVASLAEPVQAAMAQIDRGRLLVEAGRAADALAALEGLEAAGTGRLNRAQIGELNTVQARALLGLGRQQEAAVALRAAVTAQRQGDERSLGAALFLLGQVEGALGNGDACGSHLAEALIITARLGLPEQHAIRKVIERIQAQAAGES